MIRPGRMSVVRALFALAIVGLPVLGIGAGPPDGAAARTMGSGPLADVRNLAAAQSMCSGLTPDRLAAMAMVPTFPETGAPTNQAPSPMTLSRWDNQSSLYAFGTPGSADKAFFHPGIGMWQFDSAGGWPLTAATAINTATAAMQAIPMMRTRFCSASGTDAARRKYAWGPWLECQSGTLCESLFSSLLVNDMLTVDQDMGVSSTGGMELRTCTIQGIGTVTCGYVDPAKAQGYKAFATFPGGNGVSPLTAPFYVFDAGGREYRYWLRADTGYSQTIEADKPITANARTSLTWRNLDNLCDNTMNRGACGGGGPPAWSSVSFFQGMSVGETGAANNADGRVELFVVGVDGRLFRVWQATPAGEWASWTPMGDVTFPLNARPAVARNADGRLEVFVRGQDGALWHSYQLVPNGGWSPLESMGGSLSADPAVGTNADGRIEVFARFTDSTIWHAWQVAPNWYFSEFNTLYGVWPDGTRLALATNADGRLEVFGVASDSQIWHNWQVVPNGWWGGWVPLGGSWPQGRDVAVARNQDGRLEVFAVAGDGRLWATYQLAPNSGWGSFGVHDSFTYRSPPAVMRDRAGRLVLTILLSDGALATKSQVAPNLWWTSLQSLGGSGGTRPTMVENPDGRLEAFFAGAFAAIYHAWMLTPP